MKRLALLGALLVSAMAAPSAIAAPQLGGSMPDKPMDNLTMIYSTDPALQCYNTARAGSDLRYGLEPARAVL